MLSLLTLKIIVICTTKSLELARNFEQKLGESQKDPNATWKILNERINRNLCKSSEINYINVNGSCITKASEIADSFNTFFSSISSDTGENISASLTFVDHFISEF